jgi:hypothetical protein
LYNNRSRDAENANLRGGAVASLADQYKANISQTEKATNILFGVVSAKLSAGFKPTSCLIQAASSYPESDG